MMRLPPNATDHFSPGTPIAFDDLGSTLLNLTRVRRGLGFPNLDGAHVYWGMAAGES